MTCRRLWKAGAEGVGLFRTEFLFLDDSKQAPSEEKQIAAYRAVLEAFPEGRVVVRVLDSRRGQAAGLPDMRPTSPTPRWVCGDCAVCWTTPMCCGPS